MCSLLYPWLHTGVLTDPETRLDVHHFHSWTSGSKETCKMY